MTKKKIYISFDYENDRHYKNLLLAWDANKEFDFRFHDRSSDEIKTENVDRVKAVLTTKIKDAGYLLAIIGKEATKRHKDHKEIGDTNWICWEINKAKELGKKLIAVKIDQEYASPACIQGAGAKWAMSFTFAAIKKAIDEA